MTDIAILQSYPLFGGVTDQQLQLLMGLMQRADYNQGDYLFKQQDPGDRLFLIVDGEVEVLDETTTPPTQLAMRRTGDSIGEMSLIDIQNRSASVKAVTTVQVLSLSHGDLLRLYEQEPQLFILIVMNIAREISRRLRSMDTLLCNSLYQQSIHNEPTTH